MQGGDIGCHSRRRLKILPSCFPLTKCMQLCALTIFTGWYIVQDISHFSITLSWSWCLSKIPVILSRIQFPRCVRCIARQKPALILALLEENWQLVQFSKKSQLELFFQKSSVDLCRPCLGPSWMMMTNMMAWHDDEMIWWWSSQCLNVTAQFQWPKIFGQILAKIGGDVDVESKLPVFARSVPPPMYTRGEPRGRNACLRLWWRRWWWSRKQYWCWW